MPLENRWSLRKRLTNLGLLGGERRRDPSGASGGEPGGVRARWAKFEQRLRHPFGFRAGSGRARGEPRPGQGEPSPRHVPHFSEPRVWRRVTDMFAGRGSHDVARSDERILEEVRDRLSYHPYVDASEVEVSVERGDVTLSGFVEDPAAKRHAEDVAADVVGVYGVHNVLGVRLHEPTDRAPERG